ncbi:MAG: aspartate 1-decarboxylase [Bacteroidales bacterium]|nr:aspartate 1-decarboxylase [Bacteroidales bacterium]
MLTQVLKGKIHRATVTQAELDYVGSITIDETLMEASGIREYERVQVVDVNNGQRLETYVIAGKRDSGVICLNGAAARLVELGDKVIIMAYVWLDEKELKKYAPKVVFVDHDNKVAHVINKEQHGRLADQAGINPEAL